MLTKEEIALVAPWNEAMKKISKGKWEWEPEEGNVFEYKWQEINGQYKRVWHKKVEVVPFEFQTWTDEDGRYMAFGEPPNYKTRRHYFLPNCIPLLHWEKIEEILEGMGYIFQEPIRRCYGSEGFKCHCVISLKGRQAGWGWGKTRQEAVMRAVIELGKEE